MTGDKKKGWQQGFAFGLGTGAVLIPSVGLSSTAASWDPDRSYRKLRIFSQVFNYVENNYVDAIDQEGLVYGAVQGMMATLDPYTQFLPPDEYQKIKEDTTGEFGGLGIEITVKDGWLTIVAPLDDSPAARAGLRTGDRIVAIEDRSAEGMSVADAVSLLRGPANTRITITVTRTGWDAPREVALVRQRLRLNSVEQRLLGDGHGYVRIKSFQERTAYNLKNGIAELQRELREKGRDELSGLVLDLRGNPGGLVDEAVRVSDLFLESGDIVTTEGRNRRHVDRQVAHLRGTLSDFPIAVLVDEGSASASEIVAGALQDHGRAVLVGRHTFGKGSVQTIIELEDGSGLKLTVARYHTPSGRMISDGGIAPDIKVEELANDTSDVVLATARQMLLGGDGIKRRQRPRSKDISQRSGAQHGR